MRIKGWPTTSNTFRLKRDVVDWARRTEDEMVRGVYISRSGSERLTVQETLQCYLNEVTPTEKPTTHRSESITSQHPIGFLGKYSMAAVSSELVATYRDHRLAAGKANNTVRIKLALLSNLFTVAMQEWGLGLTHNPVATIRKPSPGKGRNRRLAGDEEHRLWDALEAHSNPMLTSWVVTLVIETGMRQSAIVNLRLPHDDLQSRGVRLALSYHLKSWRLPRQPLAPQPNGAAARAGIATANCACCGFPPTTTLHSKDLSQGHS